MKSEVILARNFNSNSCDIIIYEIHISELEEEGSV